MSLPIVAAEGGGNILTPDGSLLLILGLFLVFVPILNKILFQPIGRVLEERERRTTGSDTDVRAMLGSIDTKLARYEEGIREARGAGYRLVEERRATALDARAKTIAEAREAAEAKIADARAAFGRDVAEAQSRLEGDAREIADRISSTVLGRAVGGDRS
jgi:F-type H+-transporting ATPase subunit b